MKKILLTTVFFAIQMNLLFAQPATLDRSGYRLIFYDEFDYPDKTTPAPISTLGSTGGQYFYENWSYHDPHWNGAAYTFFDSAHVSLSGSGKLLLHEEAIVSPGTTVPIHNTDTTIRNCSHFSGKIDSKKNFDFGILETMVKFNRNRTATGDTFAGSTMSFASFWTCCGLNEIDMFDISTFNHIDVRALDWSYRNNASYPNTYEITQEFNPGAIDLAASFHIFSTVWDAEAVAYYLDDNLIGFIPFTQLRLYQQRYKLELALMPVLNSFSGEILEVEWVRVWTKNCSSGELELADVSVPRVPPGLHRNEKITSTSASFIGPISGNATILEAAVVDIRENFVADESLTLLGPVPPAIPTIPATASVYYARPPGYIIGDTTYNVYSNGYLEIRPSKCINCDHLGEIKGENVMCKGIFSYDFNNSTPGGRWVCTNPLIDIDIATGHIDSIPFAMPTGHVTILYIVGDCWVFKRVRIASCSREGGEEDPEEEESGGEGHRKSNNSSGKEYNKRQPEILQSTQQSCNRNNTGISVAGKQSARVSTTIKIYPNPSKDKILISYPCSSLGTLHVNIKDVAGRTRYNENVLCNEGTALQHTVDINALPPGVYFVCLTLNDQHVVHKFIKL